MENNNNQTKWLQIKWEINKIEKIASIVFFLESPCVRCKEIIC